MVEVVRDRVGGWWAAVAATVAVVVAITIVGTRQGVRVLWAHAHLLGGIKH